MTQYEAISAAIRTAFQQQEDYEEEGRRFGEHLVKAIEQYLGVPANRIAGLPPEGEEVDPSRGHLRLGNDGYFRMRVRVQCQGSEFFIIHVQFRKRVSGAAIWSVSLERDGASPRDINANMEGDFQSLIDEFAERTKEAMRNSFHRFLTGGGKPQGRIGFDTD